MSWREEGVIIIIVVVVVVVVVVGYLFLWEEFLFLFVMV